MRLPNIRKKPCGIESILQSQHLQVINLDERSLLLKKYPDRHLYLVCMASCLLFIVLLLTLAFLVAFPSGKYLGGISRFQQIAIAAPLFFLLSAIVLFLLPAIKNTAMSDIECRFSKTPSGLKAHVKTPDDCRHFSAWRVTKISSPIIGLQGNYKDLDRSFEVRVVGREIREVSFRIGWKLNDYPSLQLIEFLNRDLLKSRVGEVHYLLKSD